jgi:PRC-barrel domain
MPNLTSVRLLGAAALLSVSALAAVAQQSPPSQPPAEKPPLSKPATPPGSSQAKPAAHPLIGLKTISIDGSKVGDVRTVKTSPDGKVTALHIRSGGFLGLGGKIVAIPEGKFVQKGDSIHLSLTAEEVSKLPEVKDAS